MTTTTMKIRRRIETVPQWALSALFAVSVCAFIVLLLCAYQLLDNNQTPQGIICGIMAFGVLVIGIGVTFPDRQAFLKEIFEILGKFITAPLPRRDVQKPKAQSRERSQVESASVTDDVDQTDEDAVAEKDEEKLPGVDSDPVNIDERWPLARRVRQPIRDLIVPTYLLDNTYHFLDWNPAFDELVAGPLDLKRGDHAESFIKCLENAPEVIERAKKMFGRGKRPLVDVEPLIFHSNEFGRITFNKVSALITEETAGTRCWSVNLNIGGVDEQHRDRLWQVLRERLERTVNWSRYATSYDRLLCDFTAYKKLISTVTEKVDGAEVCIDLGAGTGNAALALLSLPTRTVWAVENNESMLEQLRKKARRYDTASGIKALERLHVIKGSVDHLADVPDSYFDAATMVNVLYAVPDPVKALREVHRVLKPRGVIALSTSHRDTDVERLFDALKDELVDKGEFEAMRPHWEEALEAHKQMESEIHRDTKDDIRRYLEEVGFSVQDWHDSEYVDAVVVVKAVKVEQVV